ncbi:hypothetical protein PRIPAC_86747, partial [Pristionchus pacificus]|uniref:Membrane transporter n=1 Tax=Pristionchus pacificus TaxID=54126 RepID=A0A2A6BM86_PRIPA
CRASEYVELRDRRSQYTEEKHRRKSIMSTTVPEKGARRPTAAALENGLKHDDKPPQPAIPYKFILIVLIGMTSISANGLTTSFTITQFHEYGNGSASDYYKLYDYEQSDDEHNGIGRNITLLKRNFLSNAEKASLMMVVPIGAILSFFPVASCYKKFGFSRTFVFCLVLSSLTTAALPLVSNAQLFSLAIIVRIIQGVSFGAFLPVIAKVGSYLSIEDFTMTTVLLFSYLQFSALLLFPLAGVLCWSTLGWHSVHYIFAGWTMFVTLVFIAYHYSEGFQRTVRQGRLFEIFYGTMAEHCSSSILTFHLPYLSIYQDLSFWGTMIGAFGYFTALQMSLQYIPLFLNKVVSLSIITTGFLSALPRLLGFSISVAAALKVIPLP